MAGITLGKPEISAESKDGMDKEEFTLRKRLPKKLPKRKTDVYVTKKTNFKAQLARCQKLLDTGNNEIYIHGLGAAICRAVNLSLQLKAAGLGSIEVSTNTSTVELVDDMEPEGDDKEPETQMRFNSAVHIKVFRPTQNIDSMSSTSIKKHKEQASGVS